jgi:hypothetical protein
MKNAWFVLLAVGVLLGVTGCAHHGMHLVPGSCMSGSCAAAPETCGPCGAGCGLCGPCKGGLIGSCLGRRAAPMTLAYPYYTTRGPRDFLVSDPKPLGP